MTLPRSGIDSKSLVLQAVDIVELIGQSVPLKRRGKDFVGLCPFHQEKTPSFHVSPAKQFFHCYGCKAGGNAIDFVMKRDRIEFIDALKLLAQQHGIELPHYSGEKQNAGERQILLDANSAAAMFFEKHLAGPGGAKARRYLEQRGFTAETIKAFRVGLAADAWDSLLQSPVGKKYTPQQLALAGLVKPRESGGGYYDTFRNRLMFPIRDDGGRIIAFGGRVMPGSEDPAKYLNSPETPLFSKGRCTYALDLARQKIVESRTVAVCEGYTDVMMAHQFGVTNVVSILGTAMSEQHVAVLRRFADRIVLLFDPDAAGQAAMNRVVELFLTQPVEIAVGSIPDGLDPDEFLLKRGKDAFVEILNNAADALTYKWRLLVRQYEASRGNLTGQQKAVQEYLETLAAARGSGPVDPLRWGAALTRVSRLTEIPVDDLNRRFRSHKSTARKAGIQVSQGVEPKREIPPPARSATAQDRAERQLLGALMVEPGRWRHVQQHVHVEEFTDEIRKRLAQVYWDHQRDEGEPVFSEFLAALEDSALRELATELCSEAEALADVELTVNEALEFLNEAKELQKNQKLTAATARTIEMNEPDPLSELYKNTKALQNTKTQGKYLPRTGPVRRSGS